MTIEEHCHDRASLNLIISGHYAENCKDLTPRHFLPGHLIFKPAGQPHTNRLKTAARSLVIELNHHVFDALCAHDERFSKPWQIFDPAASRSAQQLYYQLRAHDEPTAASDMAFELLDYIHDRSTAHNSLHYAHTPRWFGRVIDLIMVEYARSPTITELSSLAGICPTHFARAFKQATGDTPGAFIRARRVSAALALLAEDQLSGAEVAADVGFSDESHMIRTMRKALRVSPARFRRTLR